MNTFGARLVVLFASILGVTCFSAEPSTKKLKKDLLQWKAYSASLEARTQELEEKVRDEKRKSAELKAEIQSLKNKLYLVQQRLDKTEKKVSTQTPDGCILTAIASNGASFTVKTGDQFLVAPRDRLKVLKWRGGHELSFTFMPNFSTKSKKVYTVENRTLLWTVPRGQTHTPYEVSAMFFPPRKKR